MLPLPKTRSVLNILSPKPPLRKTIKIGNVNWSYLDSEIGDEIWLGFHGFGQEAEVVEHFLKTLRPNARILSFDLPLHGKTLIENGGFIKTQELTALFNQVLAATNEKSCSVLGFSLGGKVALKMTELIPEKIDRLVLIAPDGLKVNPFYWFATNTLAGRSLFQLLIRFPHPFLGMSKLLASTRVMNPKIDEFARSQMGTRKKRQKVYNTWQIFKQTTPSLNDVRAKILQHKIKTTLIFGTRDRVIHPKLAKKLSGENGKTSEVIMIEAGHHLLTKEVALQTRDSIK